MGEQPESTPNVQRARARQYLLCKNALESGGIDAGAEGIFDQALTNGLAAIVAHNWPGRDVEGPQVLPASRLLNVIQECAEDAGDGVFYVPHPDEPEPISLLSLPLFDELIPNSTVVKVEILRAAIAATQAIRHARATDEHTTVTLSDEQIEALDELSFHPALHDTDGLLPDHFWLDAVASENAEIGRAEQYLDLLGEEERKRRAAINYGGMHREVDWCEVCGTESLVVQGRDGWLDEIAIGQCVVCGYERTPEVADILAEDLDIQRKVERPD